MRKYDLYNTNIHWIGKIPTTWKLGRVKNLTYVKARIGWQGLRSDEFIDNSDWFCVTGTDFKDGSIDWSNCYGVEEWRYNQDKKIQLKLDDILITKDGTIGKIALINFLPKLATLNSGVFVTRPYLNAYDPKYFYWLLSSNVFTEFINYFKNGSTILHLYQNVFERFVFPIPSKKEQTEIAHYLDTKTQAIDKKVNLLENKIGYYKELRKSIINNAVTKGLDKNVKLKDSELNVEIANSFEVKRLKDICKTINGYAFKSSEYLDNGLPIIRIGDISEEIDFTKVAFVSEENGSLAKDSKVIKGDILMAMTGATIGKNSFFKENVEAYLNQRVCSFRVNKTFNNKFLGHFISSMFFQDFVRLICGGSAQENISKAQLEIFKIIVPPTIEEQTAIAEYLDHKTQTIDKIVSNIESQIKGLRELRKTLINDVVTGQIKVVE